MQDDNWVKRRIEWALKQHRMPRFRTKLYESGNVPAALKATAEHQKVGIPVVCCIGDDAHWTLIGSKGVASSSTGQIVTVAIPDIRRLTTEESLRKYHAGDPNLADQAEKAAFLIAIDKKGESHPLWFSTQYELFAFWNILGRLSARYKA